MNPFIYYTNCRFLTTKLNFFSKVLADSNTPKRKPAKPGLRRAGK